jgi:hypothetical protein
MNISKVDTEFRTHIKDNDHTLTVSTWIKWKKVINGEKRSPSCINNKIEISSIETVNE